MMKRCFTPAAICLAAIVFCASGLLAEETAAKGKKSPMSVTASDFGRLPDGTTIVKYTVVNGNGIKMELINYGAIMTSLTTPDKNGEATNINVGFDNLEGYLAGPPYFGATVGRYANRIAKGKFTLDGKEYTLATNNGPNSLHGGIKGFDKVVWASKKIETPEAVGVQFDYTAKDGEEGYPGNMKVTVKYTLTPANELVMDYTATTDAKTVLNLTNHNYWNLAGAKSGKNYEHTLKLEADKYLPVDETLIPTGEFASVKGTPMDFTAFKAIGKDIQATGGDPVGYDHCYVLNSQTGELALAATVKEPTSGRVMEVWTTQPGIQFYSGNFLDGSDANGGLNQHEAFCLETQHYPDTPNQKDFPTATLEPGETFHEVTVHKFSVEK